MTTHQGRKYGCPLEALQWRAILQEEISRKSEIARELLRREADWLNNRMGWLTQTQGLLFASLAFSWEKSFGLSVVLCLLGFLSSMSIGYALSLISPASNAIVKWWESQTSEQQRQNDPIVPIWGAGSIPKFLRPERMLPILFMGSWVSVLLVLLWSPALSAIAAAP